MKTPRCFISYSWDDDIQKEKVKNFAAKLIKDGINVILDQWHTVPGDQLTEFMEREIRESDFVLVICTPKYKYKSDNRKGAVGYEGDIITGEIFVKREIRKFIPVIWDSSWENSAPSFLLGKYYIDLTANSNYDSNYINLISTLFDTREQAPPIGNYPTELLRDYSNQQKQIEQQQWVKFEFVDLPVLSDSEANRIDLFQTIRNTLIDLFSDNYKSFTLVLFVNSLIRDGNEITLYSLFGHERKFINVCYEYHKTKTVELFQKRLGRNWENDKEILKEKYLEEENLYSEWKIDTNILFSKRPSALNIEYDPDLKKISILSDTNCFTDPKMYDNKLKNTSEVIKFACAVFNSKNVNFGDVGWGFENLPLYKLILDFLDNKNINFKNFRCQIGKLENWDYLNPEIEAEIKGFT